MNSSVADRRGDLLSGRAPRPRPRPNEIWRGRKKRKNCRDSRSGAVNRRGGARLGESVLREMIAEYPLYIGQVLAIQAPSPCQV